MFTGTKEVEPKGRIWNHEFESKGIQMSSLCYGTIFLEGKEYKVESERSRNLLQVLLEQIPGLSAPCGGKGSCGKCVVQVKEGSFPISSEDEKFLKESQLLAGYRLACRMTIEDDFSAVWIGKKEDDMEVLTETSANENEGKNAKSNVPKEAHENAEEVILAIDIGTTTLAFGVYDKASGALLGHASGLNHQRAYGGDVIARIQASNDGKKEKLQELIREDIKAGIKRLEASGVLDILKLKKTVIAGNTTMIHLLMAYSCEKLGEVPFTPYSTQTVKSTLKNICSYPSECPVVILPGISAFVGGDIVSGMMAMGLDKKEKPCLFLDLGTNGEMALGNKDKLLVTSTAAGPAFEGGNISCGVGSIPGAICHVTIEDEVEIETIGDASPIGICGTGVVETVAELLRAEELDETGLLEEDYFDDGYVLAKSEEGEDIAFTQKDIREIQLAKAAIRAGLETLLLRYGITYDEVDALYVAGGFGYKLDLKKAAEIGMIPEDLLDKTEAVGNTSLLGAARLALDSYTVEAAEKMVKMAKEVSLASDKDFQEFYMEYMMFEPA